MKAKTMLVFLFMGCALFSAAQPANKSGNRYNDFEFENAPLSKVLQEISATFHLKICNPRQIVGLRITGRLLKNTSVAELCKVLDSIQDGEVFFNYQGGIIYLSKTRFPKKFRPVAAEWPCN